jgi:hypothetical protein
MKKSKINKQEHCETIINVKDDNCPNCWGKSEYDGKVCDSEVVEETQKGWIQNYAEKRLF